MDERTWLNRFKANLEDHLKKEDSLTRRNVIIWELSWVDDRMATLSKQETSK